MGGKDTIVEIDEALMGKKHGPQKFGNNPNILKILVFGMFGEEKKWYQENAILSSKK